MSDTAIAIVVVPFLIVLTLALECTRIGCSRLCRLYRVPRVEADRTDLKAGEMERF